MSSSISIGHRSLVALLALLLALSLVATTPPSAAEAARGRTADETAAESALHSHHNAVRGGIGGLQRSGDLDAVARSWADTMAARGTLSHNPNYSSQIKNWSRVAENVGFFRDPSQSPVQLAGRIAERYMGSSGHRANILTAAFTQVGVGMTVGSDGSLWSVVVFRAPASGGASGGSSDGGGTSSAATTSRSAPTTATSRGSSSRPAASGGVATGVSDAEAEARAAEAQRRREAEQARVRGAQEALAALGWYEGAVDGSLGPVTAAALSAFQAAMGLEDDGTLDEATLAALGEDDAITRAAHEEALARAAREATARAAESARVRAWLVAHTAADAASQRQGQRLSLMLALGARELPDHLAAGPAALAPGATEPPDHLATGTAAPILADGDQAPDRLTRWVREPWSHVIRL
jgi:uncharacterized protein YkwD/peptidoglycan hydrolase-like protein with peptidoglycan-binding domain